MTCAAALIVGLRRALDGQLEGQVAQTDDFFTEILVNQRGVGVQREFYIVVLLCQLKNILFADERFAASHHIQVYAQFLALRDNFIHILEGQVVLVTICAGPAAGAVHVACRGRVKQNQPRNVAVILLAVFANLLGAAEECLKAQIQSRHLCDMRARFRRARG